jgi:multicomponent Na+:H+ antiporter subunit B
MNTLIFRTAVPLLVPLMVVFSLFVLLRGHNEPGGGFIGGLIAASAIAILGMAFGVPETRRALRVDPIAVAGFGVFISAFSGLPSLAYDLPFMTSLWSFFHLGETEIALSTPMVFDIGVYCVVLGAVSAIALALEDEEHEV